jgi:hypothetical protein
MFDEDLNVAKAIVSLFGIKVNYPILVKDKSSLC